MSLAIGSTTINDIKIGTASVSAVYVGTTQVWSHSPAPATNIPFYLEDVSGSANSVSIIKSHYSYAYTLTIETSTDGQTWSTLGTTSTTALNISIPANGRVYVRCNTISWAGRYDSFQYFNYFNTATGNFKAGGNIMSLLYGSNFTGTETTFPDATKKYIFNCLFSNNTYLVDASALILPSTTLADYCYRSMFQGCSSLTTAPALPATTLSGYCYEAMFSGCINLTAAPALPATTLTSSCYSTMFNSCTSLTQAPVLPATTLADSCYRYIFNGCTSLNTVTCLAENITASGCTTNWLSNVAATGTFTKSPNMSSWTTGISGIPSGWTVVDSPW